MVSVVIPTRNRRALLERAIQSVMNQTFTDWEIIVVDDASSDGTRLAMEQEKSDRLKYIRFENRAGGAAARNNGIKNAQGEFVAFLDDDDEWLPEKLNIQIECFKLNPQTGICYTGRSSVRKGKIISGLGKRYSFTFPESEDHFRAIMKDNFVGITSSVMVPRNILLSVNGFDENLPCFQDYDLFIRILKSWKAAGIDKPLVQYYLESDTQHVSFTRKNVIAALEYLLEKYKNEHHYPLLKKALRNIKLKKMIKSFGYAKEVIRNSFNEKDPTYS